ncbi:MAG: fumarate/nitrate reduction transcriptional regulator Fnr [Arenimonas sp.]
MSTPAAIDLVRLRTSCAECSLQQLCLPAGIGAEDLSRLDDIVRRRRPVERGDRLFRLGDPLTSLFVARDGAFKTVTISENGEEQVLGFHLPGDIIGLDAVGPGAHRCEAIALNTANVCEIRFDELASVSAHLPSLQQQLLRVMGQSGNRDQDHMEILGRRQANERIALFLHGLGERFRHIGLPAHAFKLPMSREEIARYLGLALETVSRGFTRLQDDGVIAVHGRHVEILDAKVLNGYAHPNDALEPQVHTARRINVIQSAV